MSSRVMLTGAREGYYRSYEGTAPELAATLEHGWLLEGEERRRLKPRDESAAAELDPRHFVFCISNHDQTGNQAFGSRLSEQVSPAAYRAASALLCLVPFTPLIFMGQEWAATTPFQYFTDHEAKLGRLITEGRRQEFSGFSAFRDPEARARIPDPQSEQTFVQSKLRWEEMGGKAHAEILRLYEEVLRLRRELPAFRDRSRNGYEVLDPEGEIIRILFGKAADEQCLVLAGLSGGETGPRMDRSRNWQPVFSSNESRFGGDGGASFAQPEVQVLRAL